jgi:hypothetical protein
VNITLLEKLFANLQIFTIFLLCSLTAFLGIQSAAKMTAIVGLLIILSSILLCTGQTFQYSRGWTNGKRSDTSAGTNILTNPPQNLATSDTDKQTERYDFTGFALFSKSLFYNPFTTFQIFDPATT